MRHHYTIQEGLYRLRPAQLQDAGFIVKLRTHPEKNRFINTTSPDISKQEDWLRRYFERAGDYYFMIENVMTGEPEGTLGIYDVNEEHRSAEWGRWIVRPGSKAALPSCCLAFNLAFSEMKLAYLYSYVAAEHQSVVAILNAFGMRQEASLPGHLQLDGRTVDAVKMRISASDWTRNR
jgi:RimJ/RimL family protein N-acetyltransferase